MASDNLIQTFTAKDNTGMTYTLYVYQEQIPAVGTRSNPNATVPGLKHISSEDGQTVSRKDKGVYELLTNFGVKVLHSDAPDAP
jgi:hypothetical protein